MIRVLLFGTFLAISIWLLRKQARIRRRWDLRVKPLSDEQLQFLKKHLPPYPLLSNAEQGQLQGFIQIFLDEKRFEGCGSALARVKRP